MTRFLVRLVPESAMSYVVPIRGLRAASFALLLAACTETPPLPSAPPPVPVRLAAVGDTTAEAVVTAAGTLGAREELPLAFKVGGVVQQVFVDAGARVRAGQRLAVIDLQEIDAGVARARAGLEKAERDLARAERLFADSVVTRAVLDDARTAVTVARADLQAVAFNRSRAEITAPAAGVILERLAEPGQLVEAGRPIVRFASDARGQAFRIGLTDGDVLRVREGDAAEIRFDVRPGMIWTGRVVEIAGAATPLTGTYGVVLAVRDAAGLPNGLVGRAVIRVRGTGAARTVPVEAVVEADGEHGVLYAYDAATKRVSRRDVTLGGVDGERVTVRAGLEGVQQVVTDGAAYLADGAEVTVVP